MRPEAPNDPTTAYRLAPAGEGRIARSWRLTRTAWRVVRRDRGTLALAGTSSALTGVVMAAIFWVAWPTRHGELTFLAVMLAATLPMTFVASSFNVAIAAAAEAALTGDRLGARRALAVPARHVGRGR